LIADRLIVIGHSDLELLDLEGALLLDDPVEDLDMIPESISGALWFYDLLECAKLASPRAAEARAARGVATVS